MRRICAGLSVGLILLQGCSRSGVNDPTTPDLVARSAARAEAAKGAASRPSTQRSGVAPDEVVALVDGHPITMGQIQQPLVEAYGLNMLLNVVQLELAKKDTAEGGIAVTEADIQAERQSTMSKMFQDAKPEEYETLLVQFLNNQRISRPEFEMVVQTNAYLRKLAEPRLQGKITDEAVKEGFAIIYGETIQVRHIQCTNMQEIGEVQRRLAAGEPFAKVAAELSRNARTAAIGGEIQPFSRAMGGLPQAFKDAAFNLKVGEISDPVQADGAYHLILLEERIPPRAVKFEDVKDVVRAELEDKMMQAAIKELRSALATQALATMKIEDPILKKQFDERVTKQQTQVKDRDDIRRELAKERERETARLATMPSTQPDGSTAASSTTQPTPSTETAPTTQP